MAKVTYRGVQYDTETRQKETKQAQNHLVTEALLYKDLSKMIVVTEILLASVVFLAIIYAEAQLLYNYK